MTALSTDDFINKLFVWKFQRERINDFKEFGVMQRWRNSLIWQVQSRLILIAERIYFDSFEMSSLFIFIFDKRKIPQTKSIDLNQHIWRAITSQFAFNWWLFSVKLAVVNCRCKIAVRCCLSDWSIIYTRNERTSFERDEFNHYYHNE